VNRYECEYGGRKRGNVKRASGKQKGVEAEHVDKGLSPLAFKARPLTVMEIALLGSALDVDEAVLGDK
jgi:hypothetical protein